MTFLVVYLNLLPFVFGALIGSFLNVVIVRWPQEMSVIRPRSACPKCNNFIAWYDNFPVVSWLILRAKCRFCKNPISWRYPAVELLTAVLSWLTFHRFVPDVLRIEPVQLGAYFLYFAFVAGLVAITFIDFEHYLIPDAISLTGIPVGIVGAFVLERWGGGIIDVRSAILGAVLGGGSLLLLRGIYYLIRRQEGMGMGDVKMLAMLGAFLGHHPALLFIIFVSSFLGSVAGIIMMVLYGRDLKYPLPFGPFLALGGLVYLLWGYEIAPDFLPTSFQTSLLFP